MKRLTTCDLCGQTAYCEILETDTLAVCAGCPTDENWRSDGHKEGKMKKTIAFDATGYNYDFDSWDSVFKDVAAALEQAGLPSVYGEDWQTYDEGCVFEGSPEQCAAIKTVLENFQVNIDKA